MKLISTALMKEQFKRNWVFMLLSMAAYTMFIILPTLLPGGRTVARAQGMLDLLSMSNPIMQGATVIIPFAVAMLLFSHLFNPRTTAVYYNYTDSKNQLFWTNVLTGVIMIVVPLIVMSLLLLIRVRVPVSYELLEYPSDLFSRGLAGVRTINTFPVIAAFFMRVLVSQLFFFSLWLLAFALSGKWVFSVIVFGLLPITPVVIHRLIVLIGRVYVFGHYPMDVTSTETIMSYSNPLWWEQSFAERAAQPLFFLIYIGIAVVLLAIANGCFVSRKLERAEDSIVFPAVKNLLVFCISIAGMIAMGAFLTSVLTGRWFLYYGFVLGFALTFCVAQIVFEKKFNVGGKVKWLLPLAGAVGVLYGIMLLITTFGMRSYIQYVPSYDRIVGVYVSDERFLTEHLSAEYDFDRDSETITETRELHRTIVRTMNFRSNLTRDERRDMRSQDIRDTNREQRDNRRDLRDTFWESITGGGRQFRDNGGEYVYITYLLNNGDRVYRRYALSEDFIQREILGIEGDSIPDEWLQYVE